MDLIKQWLGFKKQNDLHIEVSNSDEIASQPSEYVMENPLNDLTKQTLNGGEGTYFNRSFFTSRVTLNPDSVPHPVKTPPESQIIPNQLEPEATDLSEEVVQSPIKNCLSCKAIGAGTLSAAVVFLLYTGKQTQNNYKGLQKYAFISQYLILSTTLTLMVVAVVFDLGPLQDKKKGTTMLDLVKDDLYYFKEKMFSKSTK